MILNVEGITKVYGENRVLEDISLSLSKGELVSVLGASGVGKSTLFNIIAGLLKPDKGIVSLAGESGMRDITGKSGEIAYMLQKDLLLEHKNVLDNVALPLVIKGVGKREARERAASYFESFGLSGTESSYPSALSGGMRQRAALLRTYLFSERIALLDEPFSALDAITKTDMYGWYIDMIDKMKLSVLLITHDIDEAILLSDRVIILKGHPARIEAEYAITREGKKSIDFSLSERFVEYKRMVRDVL